MGKLSIINHWGSNRGISNNEIRLSNKKGWITDIHKNMNGYEKHNAELKKPRTGHTLYDSIYMKLYDRRN